MPLRSGSGSLEEDADWTSSVQICWMPEVFFIAIYYALEMWLWAGRGTQPVCHAAFGVRYSLGRMPRSRLNATLNAKALA